MTTRTHVSLLYADNKDISDLLEAAEGAFKIAKLRQIALQRGILISSKDTRADLISYLSLMPFDRAERDALIQEAAPPERQPATTSRKYKVQTKLSDIKAVATDVAKARTERNEAIKSWKQGDAIRVEMTYSKIVPSRTRLQQSTEVTVSVELKPNDDGTLEIVSTPGEKADHLIVDMINRIVGDIEPPKPIQVDMSGVRDPEKRTQFFVGIFKHMTGYQNPEVSDVRIHARPEEEDDDDEEEDDELPKGKRRTMSKKEKALKRHLANAVLSGADLLQTDFYKRLKDEGYYITRMRWRCRQKTGAEVDFDAYFQDATNARKFCYRVNTVAEPDKDGKLSAHAAPDDAKRRELSAVIQKASEASYAEVEKSLPASADGEDDEDEA